MKVLLDSSVDMLLQLLPEASLEVPLSAVPMILLLSSLFFAMIPWSVGLLYAQGEERLQIQC